MWCIPIPCATPCSLSRKGKISARLDNFGRGIIDKDEISLTSANNIKIDGDSGDLEPRANSQELAKSSLGGQTMELEGQLGGGVLAANILPVSGFWFQLRLVPQIG